MVEAGVAMFMVILAAIVMIATALAAGISIALATINALGIAEAIPPGVHLLAVLISTPMPVITIVLLQTGSLATTTEFMLHVNLMLILATV